MKKIIVIIVLLLIAGLVGGTYYSGLRTEQVLSDQMAKTQQMYGSLLAVSIDQYDRGFLTSHAKTSLQMGTEFILHLQHRITHLPWGAKVVSTLDRDAYAEGALADIEAWLPLNEMRVVSRVGMTGATRARMDLPEIDIARDGERLRLKGVALHTRLNGGMTAGEYVVGVESMQLAAPEGESLAMQGLRYAGSFRYVDGLPLGDGDLQLDRLQLAEHGEDRVVLNNLVFVVNTTLAEQALNQSADLTLERLTVAEETFSDARLAYQITGLDADSVRELQDVYRSLSADILANREPNPVVVQLEVMPRIWAMLQKGFRIQLETLELESVGGGVNLTGFLDLAKAASQDSPAFDVKNLRAEATLQMDEGTFAYGYRLAAMLKGQQLAEEEAARQADAVLRSLLAQKILVKKQDGGIQSEFDFTDGQGRLNGQAMPR